MLGLLFAQCFINPQTLIQGKGFHIIFITSNSSDCHLALKLFLMDNDLALAFFLSLSLSLSLSLLFMHMHFIRSLSTRTMAAFWKFSTLLIVCSYTSSLIAHLAKSRMTPVIKNPEDLLNQNNIKFGCVKNGSTYHFLKVIRFI